MLAVSTRPADGSTLRRDAALVVAREGTEVLSDDQCGRCAAELLSAGQLKKAATQPSRLFPAIEVRDAHRIQDLWSKARIARGARLIGYKVGLTSHALQSALQTSEPASGRIFHDTVHRAGEAITAAAFLTPRIEVELAFVLHRSLPGPGVRIEDVLRTPHTVVPALEIVDRRTDMPRTIADTIADNAAFGGIVLGTRALEADTDLRRVAATLSKNGLIEESGVSAAVLGQPAAAVAWLANSLHAAQSGLEAGQVVLSGAFMRSIEVHAGDRIRADYGACGALEVSFV